MCGGGRGVEKGEGHTGVFGQRYIKEKCLESADSDPSLACINIHV